MVKFSPCGQYIAVSHEKQIHIWNTPGGKKEFAPFALHRRYTGHSEAVTALDWSDDSAFFVTGSRDATCRIYTLHPRAGYRPVTLTAHRDKIVSVFFKKGTLDLYTVSKDGTLLVWRHREEEAPVAMAIEPAAGDATSSSDDDDDDGDSEERRSGPESESGSETEVAGPIAAVMVPKWSLTKEDKHYFLQDHAKVICAVLHKATDVLSVGFSNGTFGLYELPAFNNIHTLSISQKRISSCAVNASGEWLAFGCAKLGQLLVWEWQSETYVLKQQSHQHEMTSVAYSPDGQLLATGGADAKVKLWNTGSGFATITFTEHTAEITGLTFGKNGMVILSASLDGTVRAFDLVRYRNFRTFTSPEYGNFFFFLVVVLDI